MIQKIFYTEIDFIGIVVVLLLCCRGKWISKQEHSQQLFHYVAHIMFVMFVFDAISCILNGELFPYVRQIKVFCDASFLILTAFLGLSWTVYCDYMLFGGKKHFIRCLFYSIPAIIHSVFVLLSIHTRWIFYIDEFNIYKRGELFIINPSTIVFYFAISIVMMIVCVSKENMVEKKEEKVRILFFVLIMPFFALIIQTALYGTSVLLICCLLSLLYIFINIQNDMIMIDPITKVNNRVAFERYFARKIDDINSKCNLYILMIDVDNFKKINDTYGHMLGDKALEMIASSLKTATTAQDFISRFGGDEFALIVERDNEYQVDLLIKAINDDLKIICDNQTTLPNISLSFGYARFDTSIKDSNSACEQLIRMADRNMYKNKKMKKKAKL